MKIAKEKLLEPEMKRGRWTLIEVAETDEKGFARWLCRCDCGNWRVVSAHSLVHGTSRSCGCLQRERLDEYNRSAKLRKRLQPKGRRVVLACLDDEFELPYAVADTAAEMARILGLSYSSILRALGSGGSRTLRVKEVGITRVMYVYI